MCREIWHELPSTHGTRHTTMREEARHRRVAREIAREPLAYGLGTNHQNSLDWIVVENFFGSIYKLLDKMFGQGAKWFVQIMRAFARLVIEA